MKYQITHTTRYQYNQPVGLCQNEAKLRPRNFWRQQCNRHRLDIQPAPSDFHERMDYFGNHVTYFAVQQPHTQLTVTAISDVNLSPNPSELTACGQLTWEQARNLLQETTAVSQSQNQSDQTAKQNQVFYYAKQCLLDSPMVNISPELANYAQPSFQPNRLLVDVVYDLMSRIYQDFNYDPTFTDIATPLSDVLSHRRGVCQDFAHLAIGCLRAYGLAARYTSGYLETLTAPGKPRLVGTDASHAWFSVYVPGFGWLDFDPTNNTIPSDQHIALAWGRDYSDVTPLKGIAFGGGQHTLSVSVDVFRIE